MWLQSSSKHIVNAYRQTTSTMKPQPIKSSMLTFGKRCDEYEYVKCCDECQWYKHPLKEDFNTLHPVVAWQTFENLGINFINPICLASKLIPYIIIAVDYATKWVKAKASQTANAKFLSETIILWFGKPLELINDQGSHYTPNL